MIRKKLFKPGADRRNYFRWRNHEIFRIETFSDAVFGFAITLLVVSLEVPVTFHELIESMYGMIGFAICFTFLFLVWYHQYLYFRYFGLRDLTTVVLNAILLFVVLFYVYPLKFLFSLLTMGNVVISHGEKIERIAGSTELRELMVIYSVGFLAVYMTFMYLFIHARKKRAELHFNKIEMFHLNTQIYKNLVLAMFGVACIILSLTLSDNLVSRTGMIFMFIYPAFHFLFKYRAKKLHALASEEELKIHCDAVERSRHKAHENRDD